ncbi:MAG: glycosyltransferase family 4 protein [Chloroflexi bacterium]|nr:glycosyltransferase family 4 protein [Chloroflexota bacterium]
MTRTGRQLDSPTGPRIAFVGTYPPRRCGIATFTEDLRIAVDSPTSWVAAMEDDPGARSYPPEVRLVIDQHDPQAYAEAAEQLSREADIVCLQHEFGIFGGPSGADILTLTEGLRIPLVTTLHTVTSNPSEEQRAVVRALAAHSERLVVMNESGRALLGSAYAVDPSRIEAIPHGIPVIPRADRAAARARLGLDGRTVMLSFGLLSPSKGLEHAIAALPEVVAAQPEFLYLIAGATHPGVLEHAGEAYRESLVETARQLGVADNVRFIDRFLSRADLYELLAACDFYITPYPNGEQISSGTLAYAMGAAAVVLSTPYWHAQELLADGRGVLVPFNDPAAIAETLRGLLADEQRCEQLRERAYAWSRGATWPVVGERYISLFEVAVASGRRPRQAEPISA